MPSADRFLRHFFAGGFATDRGPTSDVAPDGNGQVQVPWLNQADNLVFELDGGVTKSPGTTKINSATLESGAPIRGMVDYWRLGSAGTPTQRRVIHVGTKVKRDVGDGTFTDIITGASSTSVPSYANFGDYLIIMDDAGSTPQKYDGTTVSAVGHSPPPFAFGVEYKGRFFAAGSYANPSRLYYSDAFDIDNGTTGAWSNYITIATDDGDGITGLAVYKDALIIFKGPYKGSIHTITGSAPTGSDAYVLRPLVKGSGAVWHNSIFPFVDDLGYLAPDGSIRSLQATANYGNFGVTHLSRDIAKWTNQKVNRTYLKKAWAVNWEERGAILLSLPINASTYPNCVLSLDYRFEQPRFAVWPAYSSVVNSLARGVDASDANRQVVLTGGIDGYVRKFNPNRYSIDGSTAIGLTARTPNLTYLSPQLKKTIVGGALGIQPLNDSDITVKWYRDNDNAGTTTVDQGGGDQLAPTSGTSFTLGTSQLGGALFVDRWFELEEGGEFRTVAYEVSEGTNDVNVSIHSISTVIQGGPVSYENA